MQKIVHELKPILKDPMHSSEVMLVPKKSALASSCKLGIIAKILAAPVSKLVILNNYGPC